MAYGRRNKKRIVCAALLALCFGLLFAAPVWGAETKAVQFAVGKSFYVIGGETYPMDAAPYVKEGRTFLPVRYLAQAAGVEEENVLWDERTKPVVLIKGDIVVALAAGSKRITVNGASSSMDVAPEIVPPGRVMLPVRPVVEALGLQVVWDGAARTVTVLVELQPRQPQPPYREFIEREYRWQDPAGNQWTWGLSIPKEMYEFYRTQPRLHELLIKEYTDKINELHRRAELLKQYMEHWRQQCQILPQDSRETARQKYLTYLQAYNSAQKELEKILQEYQELQLAYRQAEYRLMRQGYVPYVLEEANYALCKTLALKLAEGAPAGSRARIEFVAAFVQGAVPYVEEQAEYPKYPVETLVEGGDCEDKTIIDGGHSQSPGLPNRLAGVSGQPGTHGLGG